MPQEVRILPHYALRLVTVPVADKKNLRHRPPMPHKATFCRDLRSGKIVHFCRKTGRTLQIAAMDGSRMVVDNWKIYYRVR